MNNRKIRMIVSTILAGAMVMSVTACKENKRHDDNDDERTAESVVEKTPETIETVEITEHTIVTTAATTEEVPETSAVPDTSADDARFQAFFENEYQNLYDDLMLGINGVPVLYTYEDLDQDGINELLIGDAAGVYAAVSEAEGLYHVVEFNGWRTQYGPESAEYIGNGCFLSSIYNGNNYGGEFSVEVLWRYDASTEVGRVVLARLSGSWDPSNLSENLSKWELYVAADENGTLAENSEGFTPDDTNYTYTMIDFGNNYQFENGERVYNEIEQQFYSYVDAHRAGNPMDTLVWKPV